jgi:hypothetical protein
MRKVPLKSGFLMSELPHVVRNYYEEGTSVERIYYERATSVVRISYE